MRVLLVLVLVCGAMESWGCRSLARLEMAHEAEFEGADGEDAFTLEPDEQGVDLELAEGGDLAGYRLVSGKLRVKHRNGTIHFVAPRGEKLALTDADGRVLQLLGKQPDGDLTFEDGDGNRLYKAKVRDDGYKLEDSSEQEVARVKVREDKISIKDASGETILSTKDPFPPTAAACLALPHLAVEVRAGLALGVMAYGWDNP